MTYIQHRKRQVAQSVYDDMNLRLTNRGWLATNPVPQPPLLEGHPLNTIPAFPEDIQGEGTAVNTLAVNTGEADDVIAEQLGGGLYSQEYTFHFAFYAISDGAADAVFNDLHDEWVEGYVPLYNYTTKPPTFVVNMEVLSFAWTQASDQQMTMAQRRLHFGRLILQDFINELRAS